MDGMNKMAFCVVIFIAILYIQLSASVQRPAASGRLDHLIIKQSADVRTCLTNAFNDYKHAVQRALQKHNTDIQIELQKHNTHQRELRRYNHALKQALKNYNTTIDACNTPPTTTAVACIDSGTCTRDADCCDRRCTTIDPSPPTPPAGSTYICGPPRIPCPGYGDCVCGAPV
ncbi:unnamed protein product [Adineta steineri]|uniref:Uncharacterized protein n=1 Tax=Adineta steineri TaxID=433720 RepID=A0A814X2I5_9BILA|nr:unnamed protein product [Adineta steineri]CAF4090132.1 unnamed protein product [Adineta steineri]